MTSNIPSWIQLNNEIMLQKDGKFQFEKDKEAVHRYFIDYVNQNTVFFHSLKEKIDYLIKNDYYEEEFLSKYDLILFLDEYIQHSILPKFTPSTIRSSRTISPLFASLVARLNPSV